MKIAKHKRSPLRINWKSYGISLQSGKVSGHIHVLSYTIHSDDGAGIVASKNETLQQARNQICEHQLTIENLTADLKLADRCTAHLPDHYLDDDAAEVNCPCPLIDKFDAVLCALCVTPVECSTCLAFLS